MGQRLDEQRVKYSNRIRRLPSWFNACLGLVLAGITATAAIVADPWWALLGVVPFVAALFGHSIGTEPVASILAGAHEHADDLDELRTYLSRRGRAYQLASSNELAVLHASAKRMTSGSGPAESPTEKQICRATGLSEEVVDSALDSLRKTYLATAVAHDEGIPDEPDSEGTRWAPIRHGHRCLAAIDL